MESQQHKTRQVERQQNPGGHTLPCYLIVVSVLAAQSSKGRFDVCVNAGKFQLPLANHHELLAMTASQQQQQQQQLWHVCR
jgi:hypothetical protein